MTIPRPYTKPLSPQHSGGSTPSRYSPAMNFAPNTASTSATSYPVSSLSDTSGSSQDTKSRAQVQLTSSYGASAPRPTRGTSPHYDNLGGLRQASLHTQSKLHK